MEVTKKNFGFCTKNDIPLYYVSASDGTNVVKVSWVFNRVTEQRNEQLQLLFQMFNDAIAKATEYKKNPTDIEDQILDELERM